MKLLSKVLIIVFFISLAQAKKEEHAMQDCSTSEMMQKSHLSCIACGLKKIGRPIPDDNYLGMMGLLVRENAALFPDEQNPKTKHDTRRDLKFNPSQIVDTGAGPVEFTARMQYQKSIIQMILASGYCSQGKIKSKVKDNKYTNFIERINSSRPPVDKKDKKAREQATEELGFDDWSIAQSELWLGNKKEPFFSLSFDKQKELYRNRRVSALNRNYSDDGYRPKSEIADCLSDIDSNYMSSYASNEKSYEACTAIYDACEIATTPLDGQDGGGEIYRKNAKGEKVRVGGDWCASKYNITSNSSPERKTGTLFVEDRVKNSEKAPGLRSDGTSLAPVEDKSSRSIGNGWFISHDGKIFNDDPKKKLDPSKIEYKNGTIVISKDAYLPIPTPASETTNQPADKAPPK